MEQVATILRKEAIRAWPSSREGSGEILQGWGQPSTSSPVLNAPSLNLVSPLDRSP